MVYFLFILVFILISAVGFFLSRQKKQKNLYQIARQQLKESQMKYLQLDEQLRRITQEQQNSVETETDIQAQVQVRLNLKLTELEVWEEELAQQEDSIAAQIQELEQQQILITKNQELEAAIAKLSRAYEQLQQDSQDLYDQIGDTVEQKVTERTAEQDWQLEQLRLRNERLHADIQRLYRQRSNPSPALPKTEFKDKIVIQANEPDLYGHEKLGIVLETLNNALCSTQDYTRRHAVIADLVACNDNPSERAELEATIRQLFTGYRRMNGSLTSQLSRLGFEIVSDNNHYKLHFQGDSRYPITLSRTSSDERRGGANIASQICNQLL